jgi:hypothetical protein
MRRRSSWTLPRRRLDGRSVAFGGFLGAAVIAATQLAAGLHEWSALLIGGIAAALVVVVGE